MGIISTIATIMLSIVSIYHSAVSIKDNVSTLLEPKDDEA